MESKGSDGVRSAGRYARATALLRALTGVQDARIEADTSGIRAILVTADPGASPWEVTRNVQSALLASLGLSVDRAAVRVQHGPAARQPVAVAVESPASEPLAPPPANGNGNGKSNGHGPATSATTQVPGGLGRSVTVETAGAARPLGGVGIARLELEQRGEGRLGCRVVLTLAGRIAAGQAEGEDTARGRLEAAARAVIAAAPAVGAELEGLRQVEVAGRNYVVVAVRCWSGREMVYNAGTAVLEASPEAAAARAALDALTW